MQQVGKKQIRRKKTRNWQQLQPKYLIQPHEECDLKEIHSESPVECFKKVFTMELVDHIVEQTNLYSRQHGRNVEASREELLGIIGIMILSGYRHVHDKRMLWSSDEDVSIQWVKDLMPRNRFIAILRDIHLADNCTLDKSDPYYKVRPYFEQLNRNFKENLELDQNLSVDECMVPYFGRHNTKQFIRGKPIRFGYKLWAMASSSGFLYHAEPYCGSSTRIPTTGYGQGFDVVTGLCDKCSVGPGHYIFFDNLFTSLTLLDNLSERGIGGCGTMRENRLEKAPFTDKKVFEKEKGATEWYSDGNNLVVRWNDNKPVTVATNFASPGQKFTAKRYKKDAGGHVTVDMPGPLHSYNKYMGGVDLFDQCLSKYRCTIRSKKVVATFPVGS